MGLAAQFYFGRRAEELDAGESALLVALVRGPSVYNPRKHPKRALVRRNAVLDTMRERNVITAEQAKAAKASPLGVVAAAPDTGTRHAAFIELVRRQLARDYQAEDLRSEGLRVFTTLDPGLQRTSEQAVKTRLARIEKGRGRSAGELEAAVVVSDPQSAEVLALVGGRDPTGGGFNRALDARSAPSGRSIKPVVYLSRHCHRRDSVIHLLDADPGRRTYHPQGPQYAGIPWDSRKTTTASAHGPVPLDGCPGAVLQPRHGAPGNGRGAANRYQAGRPSCFEKLGHRVAACRPYPSLLLGAVDLSARWKCAGVYQTLAGGRLSGSLCARFARCHGPPSGEAAGALRASTCQGSRGHRGAECT